MPIDVNTSQSSPPVANARHDLALGAFGVSPKMNRSSGSSKDTQSSIASLMFKTAICRKECVSIMTRFSPVMPVQAYPFAFTFKAPAAWVRREICGILKHAMQNMTGHMAHRYIRSSGPSTASYAESAGDFEPQFTTQFATS